MGRGLISIVARPAVAVAVLAPGLVVAPPASAASDLERVARLTREAQLYGFEDPARRGGDWLQQRGHPL